MKNYIPIIALISVSLAGTTACTRQASFEKQIQPILQAKCASCHDGTGEGVTKSKFSVKDYGAVMHGTKFGPVVVAGNSESSTLYRLISHKADPEVQMPPHHSSSLATQKSIPLTQAEINIIKLWIDQGAHNN